MDEQNYVPTKSRQPSMVEVYVEPRQEPSFVAPGAVLEMVLSHGSTVVIMLPPLVLLWVVHLGLGLVLLIPAFILATAVSSTVSIMHQRWLHQRLAAFHELQGPSFFVRGFSTTLRDCNFGSGVMQIGTGGLEIRGTKAYVAVPAAAIADITWGKQGIFGEVRVIVKLKPGMTRLAALQLRFERYRDDTSQLPHNFMLSSLQAWRESLLAPQAG